ncbi:MAG TPA: cytochrome c [Terriglobales bacterium]|nr:cytochrome c [Terriglobales bacterium]
MRILIPLICVSLLFCVSCSGPAQSPPSVQAAPPQVKAPAPQAISGQAMYTAYCASCHGVDGKGGGPAAPALKSRLPDLTLMAKKKNGRFPEGDVFQVIKWGGGIVGHGSKEMPVWGIAFRTLSPKDEAEVNLRIKSLIQYLESIQQK